VLPRNSLLVRVSPVRDPTAKNANGAKKLFACDGQILVLGSWRASRLFLPLN
jgi:hypothetical protein